MPEGVTYYSKVWLHGCEASLTASSFPKRAWRLQRSRFVLFIFYNVWYMYWYMWWRTFLYSLRSWTQSFHYSYCVKHIRIVSSHVKNALRYHIICCIVDSQSHTIAAPLKNRCASNHRQFNLENCTCVQLAHPSYQHFANWRKLQCEAKCNVRAQKLPSLHSIICLYIIHLYAIWRRKEVRWVSPPINALLHKCIYNSLRWNLYAVVISMKKKLKICTTGTKWWR